jgi:hypothetical protein
VGAGSTIISRWAVPVAGGLLATLGALAIVIVEAAGGHGTYVSARIFFPIPVALASATWKLLPLAWLVGLIQIPIQIRLVTAAEPGQGRWRRIAWVALIHLVFVGASFLVGQNVAPSRP